MADHPVPSERARELVRGAFDPYVHVAPDFAPRRITDLELAAALPRARPGGLRADVALHRDGRARRGGQRRRRPGGSRARARSCSTTRSAASNATAVEVAARQGARIVWLPTVSALGEFGQGRAAPTRTATCRCGCASSSSCARPGARPRPVPVLDADGAPLPGAAARCCDVVARARPGAGDRAPLARRDLRRRRRRRRRGRRDDRGHQPRVPVARAQPRRPAWRWPARGALLQRALTTPYTGKCTWEEIFAATRAVGARHTVWGSDLGQVFNPPVEDGLALLADRHLEAGFSERGGPDRWRSRTRGGWSVPKRVQVIGAHSADFVWRAGGAVAKAVSLGGDGRGDRALLRRARRVRRAVEAGGPDGRERQADPPRRGRGRRGASRRVVPLPGPRRLPAADRRRRAAGDRRRDPRVRARRADHAHRHRPVQPRPPGRPRRRRPRPRARRRARASRARSPRSSRRSCSCSSPTSPSCATSPRPCTSTSRPVWDQKVAAMAEMQAQQYLQTYYAQRGEQRGNHARRASGG